MRQLVQSVRSGNLRIVEAPDPIVGPTEVLVQTSRSIVSSGTERAVRKLASASLLHKARARPDLVRQVVRRARESGVRSTLRTVQARLDEEMPLGYSAAGRVIEVGEAVAGIRPGMRVATGGAGHGDLQVVAGLLAVPVPDAVTDDDAAFATVASIALHGLRMADVGPGSTVCVVGLGLVGQLTIRLATAGGMRVFGVDVRRWTVDHAASFGVDADVEQGDATTRAMLEWSRGRGADAVVVTAATSSSEPMRLAAQRLRDRGRVVVVGDVGLDLDRTPLYEKEISVHVARSYGPGRYDRAYEEWGVDYPIGHVRFTEGRNLETVLDLLARGQVGFGDVITHRFEFTHAAAAYELLSDPDAQYLAIELTYDSERPARTPTVALARSTARPEVPSIALVGAGNFARGILVPAIKEAGLGDIVSVSSASGVSAARLADGIATATASTIDEAIDNPNVDIVVIATRHDSHAELTARALRAGKHVFCEKPLALTEDELTEVVAAWRDSGRHLAVGFNRRHSADVRKARAVFERRSTPLCLVYRVSAGSLPDSHWYNDRRMGGRLIGEVCHFIDTCNAIVGHPVRLVGAVGDIRSELLLSGDVVVSLAYSDGSTASIAYATGGDPRTAKERLEVLGGGHTVVLDDFRTLTVDGKDERHPQDKGHVEQLRAFGRQLAAQSGARATLSWIATTAVSITATGSLLTGTFTTPISNHFHT